MRFVSLIYSDLFCVQDLTVQYSENKINRKIGSLLIFWFSLLHCSYFWSKHYKWRAFPPLGSVLGKCCSQKSRHKIVFSLFLSISYCRCFYPSVLFSVIVLLFIAINKLIHLFIYHQIYWVFILLAFRLIIIREFSAVGSNFQIFFIRFLISFYICL